ncbi:CIA30 family protein [Arsukibacterium sp. MJ3]|uniref:CIA30 family protein n=1 Tax=Arsukibacterium sp. MJ3 TaxID=1632859 RepID=UPI00128CB06B|nr:CIA30 family protein [Arsukibacterium sp. MJ3]
MRGLLLTFIAFLAVACSKGEAVTLPTRAFNVMPGSMLLEFNNASHFSQVQLIHDTVMGGRSDGMIRAVTEPAGLQFFGNLSLANNGGFASAEFTLAQPVPDRAFNGLQLNVASDGRAYQLRLKTPYIPRGVAYVAEFSSSEALSHYLFQPTAFVAQFRGRRVSNVPPLNFADISHISVMLADKNAGPYSIVLYSIQLTTLQSI